MPPALLDADLILDSRLGVEIDGDSNVLSWNNLGTGAITQFVDLAPLLFERVASDADFNGEPVLLRDDTALASLLNEQLGELIYLHDGSAFTLFTVMNVPDDDANNRTMFATSNGGAAQGPGIRFVNRGTDGVWQLDVYDDAGDFMVNAGINPSPTPGTTAVLTCVCDGAGNYNFYVDGAPAGTGIATGPYGPTFVRLTQTTIGQTSGGGAPLNGKVSHLSTWARELSAGEITAVSDYLLETFVP